MVQQDIIRQLRLLSQTLSPTATTNTELIKLISNTEERSGGGEECKRMEEVDTTDQGREEGK